MRSRRTCYRELHRAAEAGYARIVQVLLEKGADPQAVDRQGGTPLHGAAQQGAELALKLAPPDAHRMDHVGHVVSLDGMGAEVRGYRVLLEQVDGAWHERSRQQMRTWSPPCRGRARSLTSACASMACRATAGSRWPWTTVIPM